MDTKQECPKCSLMILTNQFESHKQTCNIKHPKLNQPIFSQQKLQQQQQVQYRKPINITKALAEQKIEKLQKATHGNDPKCMQHQIGAQLQDQQQSEMNQNKDFITNQVPRCECCKQSQPKEIFQLQYLDKHKLQNKANTAMTIPLITNNQQPPINIILQPPQNLRQPIQLQQQLPNVRLNLNQGNNPIVRIQEIIQGPPPKLNQQRKYEDVYQKQKQLNIDKMTDEQIYEYFTELDQQNRIGLQKQQIDMLVRYTYTPDLKVNECNICKEDYSVGDSVARLLCVHLFHYECLTQWLAVSKQCPICKFEVDL